MSDRPTVPDPDRPEETPSAGADETALLPQADQAAPTGDTATLPPQQPAEASPGWASAPGATAPPPGATEGWPAGAVPAASVAASASPGGPRRWWGEATSTGGGRAALVIAAVLGALLLLTGIGLTAALVAAGHDGWDDDERVSRYEEMGPGMGNGRGQGQGDGKGQGQGQGQGRGGVLPGPNPADPADPAYPAYPGNGMGAGRGVAGPDDVLHGEYTTNVTGTPTVMVVQTGQVTAFEPGSSLTVESSDGFEATYALDGTAATTRGATELATGVQVRVVAAKEGMKVTRLAIG